MIWHGQSRLDPNGPVPTDQKLTKAMRQHIKKIPILYEKQIQTHTAPGRKARRKVEGTTHVCLCIALIENCKSFAEENASASQAVSQPKRTRAEIEKNVQK